MVRNPNKHEQTAGVTITSYRYTTDVSTCDVNVKVMEIQTSGGDMQRRQQPHHPTPQTETDADTDTTTHTSTSPSQAQVQANLISSGTRSTQVCPDSCIERASRQTTKGPWSMHSGTQGTEGEPTEPVITSDHCHCH